MFAVNNGVVTYNGTPTTNLSPEQIRRMYGSVGNILGANERDSPDMFEDFYVGEGDAGGHTERRVRQDLQNRLYRDGQWWRQVGNVRSVGGEGEVSDLGGIEWDDELGYITPMSNVREYSGSVFTPAMLALAGGALAAIGAAGGFSGLLGGAGGTNLGTYAGMTTGLDGVTGTLAGEAAGGFSGLLGGAGGFPEGAGIAGDGIGGLEVSDEMRALLEQGTAAHGAAADAAANFGIEQGLGVLNGLPTGVISDALGSGASSLLSNLNNPANLARLLMGGAGLANAASNRNNSNSNNPGGGNPTNYDLPAGVQSFNPAGLLGGYTPRQVSLVPFMSQSSLLGGK